MSSITIEELKKLPAESYQIIDVRDEIEISHGAVKGALACKPEEIMENPEVDKTRKLVICCSRGINSNAHAPPPYPHASVRTADFSMYPEILFYSFNYSTFLI